MADSKKRRHSEPSDSAALQDYNSPPAGTKEGKKRKTGKLAAPETTGTDSTKRPSKTQKLLEGIEELVELSKKLDSNFGTLTTSMEQMNTKITTIHDEVTKMTRLPAHVIEHMNSLKIVHDLCWGFKENAEEYDEVFFTAKFHLPGMLRFQNAFEKPEEAMNLELGTTTVQSQKIMDLKKHPRYPVDIQTPLLPGGEDRLVLLRGYEILAENLEELDDQYRTFQPSPDVGDQPPSRNSVKPALGIISSSADSLRRPTAIQPYQIRGAGYFLFTASGVTFVRMNSGDELDFNRTDKNVWAIIDDYPLAEFGSRKIRDWLFCWTSSPNKQKHSTWAKEVQASVSYLDVWLWKEIYATSYNQDATSLKKVRYLYCRYGGIPRTILRTIGISIPNLSNWPDKIDAYDHEVRQEIAILLNRRTPWPCAEPGEIFLETASSKVVFLRTAAPRSRSMSSRCASKCVAQLATPYIIDLVAEYVSVMQEAEKRRFYRMLSCVPELRTAAGRLFERAVHKWLGNKIETPLELREALGTNTDLIQPNDRTFMIKKTIDFHSLKDLTLNESGKQTVDPNMLDVYFRPISISFKAVDSFLLSSKHECIIFFQATMAETHPIIADGIQDIMKILPAQFPKKGILLFIVSEDCKLKAQQSYQYNHCTKAATKDIKQRIVKVSEDTLFGPE